MKPFRVTVTAPGPKGGTVQPDRRYRATLEGVQKMAATLATRAAAGTWGEGALVLVEQHDGATWAPVGV